jgi:putative resolvase
MSKLITIGKAAKMLGVATSTLRRWELEGKLIPERTKGGQRRYNAHALRPNLFHTSQSDLITIAYCRVSSQDQKADLEQQKQVLETYCAAHGWPYEIISDLGSGMNYHKKGLRQLLEKILEGKIGRLVLTHKDRLLRFGAELIFALCEHKGIEIVLINKGEQPPFEEELAQDVLEIITIFSARLYGSRSRKNKKLVDDLKHVIQSA